MHAENTAFQEDKYQLASNIHSCYKVLFTNVAVLGGERTLHHHVSQSLYHSVSLKSTNSRYASVPNMRFLLQRPRLPEVQIDHV